MSSAGHHVLLTGPTGYIGRALMRVLARAGVRMTLLSRRRPPLPAGARHLHYRLERELPEGAFDGITAVIHLAAETRDERRAGLPEGVELAAAERLLAQAARHTCRLVFVSSQSAAREAPTRYGRVKWRIEQRVLAAGGRVVRPGLVYGGEALGLFGRLIRMVRALPVLPDLRPRPRVQPVHVEDLCRALYRLAVEDLPAPAVTALGDPEGMGVGPFLKAIARYRLEVFRPLLLVPLPLLVGLSALGRRWGRSALPGGDRLLALAALPKMETLPSLRALDLTLRPLADGMRPPREDRRKRLLREGRALLHYVVGVSPDPATMRRYVRAVETVDGGQPLDAPPCVWRFQWTLRLADPSGSGRAAASALGKRLEFAVALAEATPWGARRFLRLETGSCVGSLGVLVWLGVSELVWQLLGRAVRRVFPATRL